MTRKTENDQISTIDRLDNVRKELEAKIDKIDGKVEKKVSFDIFKSTIAGLILLVSSILAYLTYQINELNNKIDDLNKNVAVAETKVDDGKHFKPQF